MKKFIKIFALCLTLALMLSVSALAADLVVESVPAELKLSDAETLNLNITGSYEADKLVSLEVKSDKDGKVVLYQQAICDEYNKFVLSGIMSDDVEIGSYTAYIGAQGKSSAQTFPIEVVPNGTAVTVDLVNAGQSYVTVSVNDAEAIVCPTTEVYPAGTKLLLTAVCDETHEFLYWKDPNVGKYGKILREKDYMEVYVGLDTTYEAVFANKTDEDIYVTFKANNQILANGIKGAIEVPENPYIAGYTFDGWFVNGVKFEGEDLLAVEATTTYVAGFLVEETEYTVTVNGVADERKYKYNEKATVTADAKKEGQVFVKWTRDDKDVSYDLSYSFFVNADTALEAVYGTEREEGVVLVMAQPTVVATNKIAFYAERNVPAEYKVIESGILLSQEADFDLKSDGIIRRAATYTSNNAQFTLRKANVNVGDTWYGRAYLIYSDGVETYTVYSNIAGCTRTE